jgi:hypothetical protein
MPGHIGPPLTKFSESGGGKGGGRGAGSGLAGKKRSRAWIGRPYFTPFTATLPVVTLNASACPAPQTPAALLLKANAGTLGNAPVAKNPQAEAAWRVNAALPNATQLDLTGRYGGGSYAVAAGLVLSAPVRGLNIHISAGHAVLDGIVEVATDLTWPVPASTARVWIWLLQSGLPQAVATSLSPPSGACCLLGSCTTDSKNITGLDLSGVLYLRGGMPWRQSADAGVPGDVPPTSLMFYHRTAGGLYIWDGTAYTFLG